MAIGQSGGGSNGFLLNKLLERKWPSGEAIPGDILDHALTNLEAYHVIQALAKRTVVLPVHVASARTSKARQFLKEERERQRRDRMVRLRNAILRQQISQYPQRVILEKFKFPDGVKSELLREIGYHPRSNQMAYKTGNIVRTSTYNGFRDRESCERSDYTDENLYFYAFGFLQGAGFEEEQIKNIIDRSMSRRELCQVILENAV